MKDYININIDVEPEPTDDIEECGNKGCAFNKRGDCTAHGTECFGYIDPECD